MNCYCLPGRLSGSSTECRDVDDAVPVYRHLADCGPIGNGVESGAIGPLVRGPEGAGRAVRNAPGVDELRIGDRRQSRDVRDQIDLNKTGHLGVQRTGA